MTEIDRLIPKTIEDELLQGVTLTTIPYDEPKRRHTIVEDLRSSAEAARRRMHLHALTNLSARAIRSRYPNLIKTAQFDQQILYDPLTDDMSAMAAFQLWTTDGHVMMADGAIARRPHTLHDYRPEDYSSTLITVHDLEIRGYTPSLQTGLLKALSNLATTIPVRETRREWVQRPVTRARLRADRSPRSDSVSSVPTEQLPLFTQQS